MTTTIENGSTANKKNKTKHIVDILATDKQKGQEVLERAEARIKEFEVRLQNAYTPTEKDVIKEKIELLSFNYKSLKEKFEKNHGNISNNKLDPQMVKSNDPIGDLEDLPNGSTTVVTEEMIDNDKRKVGSYGRSFDSGFHGYTKKEAAAIKKLIPDVHKPVKFSKPKSVSKSS
jgi:hypothetical protein